MVRSMGTVANQALFELVADSSTKTIAIDGVERVPWDRFTRNTAGAELDTSADTVTFGQSGVYRLTVQVSFKENSTAEPGYRVEVHNMASNRRLTVQKEGQGFGNTNNRIVNGTMEVSAGDTIEVTLNNPGSNQISTVAGEKWTYFSANQVSGPIS